MPGKENLVLINNNKYKTVKRTEYENRGNAPVYIDTSEVLCDTMKRRTVMRLKLYNNSPRTVKSVYLNVGCFDENLNLCVQLKNIPYVNMDAAAYSGFGEGQLVEVPELTNSVFVEVSKILFDDSSMWVNENQELDEDIVSEKAVGEDWNRLRMTKAIHKRETELKEKKAIKKRLPFRSRVLIWTASAAAVCLLAAGVVCVRNYFSDRRECYKTAMNYYINRDYSNAAAALRTLDDQYIYFGNEEKEIRYSAAISNMQCGNYSEALRYFMQCGNYKHSIDNIRKIADMYSRLIAAGANHSAVVSKNGTVSSFGDNSYKQCETQDWLGVAGVSASGNHTVAVTVDGTMFGTGDNDYGQCDVTGWLDIVQAATGNEHTAALKTNGRVIARGNDKYGQCDVQDWEDIVWVSASGNHTVALKNDGTVDAVGWNNYGQCDVQDWKDIALIATGEKNTVGIKYDGTVVVAGDNSRGQCDTSELKDIVFAAVGNEYIVYVDASGRVNSKGLNSNNQGSVSLWNNIITVACGSSHTLAVDTDGKVYAIGDDRDGKLKASSMTDIGAENIPVTE